MVTGRVKYDLELRDVPRMKQPQAEIQFDVLVSYLLDRGATPNATGIRLLRTMGIQTPRSTPLLVSPGGVHRAILSVSEPDETEGHLSLHLYWSDELTERDATSLPPYWARLQSEGHPTIQLLIGDTGLENAKFESSSDINFSHLLGSIDVPTAMSMWFASSIVSVLSSNSLWHYTMPKSVITFSRKDTIPSGVLTQLSLLPEVETPLMLERARARQETIVSARHAEFLQDERQRRANMALPPAQREAAERLRSMSKGQKMMDDMQAEQRRRRAEELDKKEAALTSPRVSNKIVADACLKYLLTSSTTEDKHKEEDNADKTEDKGKTVSKEDEETDPMKTIAEDSLYKMMVNPEFARKVSNMLESWHTWSQQGVMNDQHLDDIQNHLDAFSRAAILVYLISEKAGSIDSWAGSDLAECQKAWRTVYLG